MILMKLSMASGLGVAIALDIERKEEDKGSLCLVRLWKEKLR